MGKINIWKGDLWDKVAAASGRPPVKVKEWLWEIDERAGVQNF
jgi:hypothetical protein